MTTAEITTRGVLDIQGLHSAFVILYTLGALTSVVIFLITTILSTIDAVSNIINYAGQKAKTSSNKGLIFLRDTQESQVMQYITKSAVQDEPYHIFLQQNIVSVEFIVLQILLLLVALHVGIYIVVLVIAMVTKRNITGDFPRPLVPFGITFAVALLMVVSYVLYKAMFVKSARKMLAESRARLRDIKSYIYANLSTNDEFLQALRNNNQDMVLQTIKGPLKRYINRPTSDVDFEVHKMMFTMSLYEYFRYQIPDSDPAWEQIRSFFTAQEIQAQKFDPTDYFYFGPPIIITNVYPSLADQKDPSDSSDNSIREMLGAREKAFRNNLDMVMRELNKRLSYLKYQTKGNQLVTRYIWTTAVIFWIASMIGFMVLPGWIRAQVISFLSQVASRIYIFFMTIWIWIKSRFANV